MNKVLIAIMTVVLVVGLVGGGAFAYFSDTETSTGNTFTAGTLDIGLSNNGSGNPTGGISATWTTPANWAPGNTYENSLFINNDGSIAVGVVKVQFDYGSITNGTPSSVHPVGTATTDYLDQMISVKTATFGVDHVSSIEGLTLAQMKGNEYSLGAGLDAKGGLNAQKVLNITWEFNKDATNGCQGDSIAATATVNAYQ